MENCNNPSGATCQSWVAGTSANIPFYYEKYENNDIQVEFSESTEIIYEPAPPLDEPDSEGDKPIEESTLDDLDIEIW
jgi:hypothetical protein